MRAHAGAGEASTAVVSAGPSVPADDRGQAEAARPPRRGAQHRRPSRPRPWLTPVLVAIVYALLSCLANGSAWAHGVTHTLQTSGGNDVGEEVWFLAQTPWALLHGHNPFVNDWLNTPVGLNLMDNTTMPLLGLLFAPVTLLFGPIATFNVVLDAAIWASAMAFFLMARRFVGWWPAAFVGGLLYGFSPYTAAVGNGHLFLLFQAAPPLVVLFLHRFFRSGAVSPWWTGVAVGACYVAQFYVSTEAFAALVIMTAVAAVLAGAAALARHVPVDTRRLAKMASCAAAVVVIGTAYASWIALEGPEHVHGPVQSATAIAGMSTDPVGLVVPTLNQHFTLGHASLGDTLVAARDANWNIAFDSLIENGTYVGVPLLLVLVVGVVLLRRRRMVLFSAAMGAVALVLSLGTHLHVDGHRTGIPLPYDVFAHLPLLNSAVAARWICYFWLFAALLLSLIVDALYTRVAGPRQTEQLGALGACALLSVCVLVPLVPAWPYASAAAAVPPWFTTGARALPVGSTVVVYPAASPDDTSPMVWQAMADMRFRMPGGFAIFTTPSGTASFSPRPSVLLGAMAACAAGTMPVLPPGLIRSQLRAVHASSVAVIAGAPGSTCAQHLFAGALGAPRQTGGVLLWRA